MQIASASFSLDTSYQLDLKAASVTASSSPPANSTAPLSAPAATDTPPAKDAYLGSAQGPSRHGHGHGLNRWLSRLEGKLEKGDVAGAEQQIDRILARIVQQLEKPGNDALKQVTQGNQAAAKGTTASGSAVQFHDEAKVNLSLSFQTADGQQFSIEAAIDVSRTFARQQVSVPQAS